MKIILTILILLSSLLDVWAIVPSIESSATFNTSNTSRFSMVNIDASTFVLAYSDGSSPSMKAVVGKVSAKTISFGTPVSFGSGAGSYVDVAKLSSGYLIFAWVDPSKGNGGNSIVGRVSGTSISLGSPTQFDTDVVTEVRVCALGSNSFTVLYSDDGNSDYGTVCVGEVSGSNISYGSNDVFENSITTHLDICAVNDTDYLIVYGANSDGNLIVGRASGGTSSFGTPVIFEGAATAPYARLEQISNRAFVCAYQDNATGDYGTLQLLTVNNGAITLVNNGVFNKDVTNDIGLAVFEQGKLIVTYRDQNNSEYGTLNIITYDGTTPTVSSQLVYQEQQSRVNHVVALSSYEFVVSGVDGNNGSYGVSYYGIAPNPPTVQTLAPTYITQTQAQLNARLRDNGAQTTVIFQYGTSISDITNIEVDQSPVAGNDQTTVINQDVINLQPGTQYLSRIQAWNVSGTSTGEIERFTTESSTISVLDSDGDGISDEDEEGGPNDGDANNDGIEDSRQSYVVSLYSEYSQSYLTIESLDCEIINDAQVVEPNDSSIYLFPFGAVDFRVTCSESRIRIYYHNQADLSEFSYRKKDANEEWFDFDVEFKKTSIGGRTTAYAEFTLRDGGREDYDGEINNVINDPGGPVVVLGAQIPNFPHWIWLLSTILILVIITKKMM